MFIMDVYEALILYSILISFSFSIFFRCLLIEYMSILMFLLHMFKEVAHLLYKIFLRMPLIL